MIVKFQGGLQLEAALKELGDKGAAKRTSERALSRAATPIRDRAVELAPDDPATGLGKFLRESIKIGQKQPGGKASRLFRRGERGKDTAEVWVGIDDSVKPAQAPKTARRRKRKAGGASGGGVGAYSIFIEMGTSSMAAQPYMRPAWEEKKQEAFDRLAADLWDEISKTAARQARKRAKAR